MGDALDRLIEAVEAGRDIFPSDFPPSFKGKPWAIRAHNGSLDAALALHEALLPEWTRDVDATAPECGITVTLHKPYSPHSYPDEGRTVSANLMCEARAWFLAILKAYRAQVQHA